MKTLLAQLVAVAAGFVALSPAEDFEQVKSDAAGAIAYAALAPTPAPLPPAKAAPAATPIAKAATQPQPANAIPAAPAKQSSSAPAVHGRCYGGSCGPPRLLRLRRR